MKFQEINGTSFSGHVLNLKKNGLSLRGGGGGGSVCLGENSLTLFNLLKGTFPKKLRQNNYECEKIGRAHV